MAYNPHRSADQSLDGLIVQYIRRGLRGKRLRIALANDQRYRQMLRERRKTMKRHVPTLKPSERSYVFSTDDDIQILLLGRTLKRRSLSVADRKLVNLILTQLQDDWRSPLRKMLNTLMRKYRIRG